MKIVILFFLMAALSAAKYVRQNHDYWYSSNKQSSLSGVPYIDFGWNYCDKKCLYLQNYLGSITTFEFVVISFEQSATKADFAACYALDKITDTYKIWSDVIDNTWFEDHCGGDDEDWMENHGEWKKVPRSQILAS